MRDADAAEELQALAQAGWTITLWQEAPRARRGPLAAKGPTFVVEAGGVTGYDDDQAGEGATLADAVGALVDRLRAAYPDDDAPEEHTTQGAPLAAVPDDLRERLAALAHTQWSGWMAYQFARMRQDEVGRWIMGTADAARWQRQMGIPYEALREDEKASDRAQADRVLAVLRQTQGERS